MYYSYKLKSHPGRLLKDHLESTAYSSREKIELRNFRFAIPKKDLSCLAYIIGASHDIGKGTLYFQNYLDCIIQGQKDHIDEKLKKHSFLSSIFTFIFTEKYIHNISENFWYKKYLPYICYATVLRHHGDLKNLDEEVNFNSIEIRNNERLLRKQLDHLNLDEILCILKGMGIFTESKSHIEQLFWNAFNQITEGDEVYDKYKRECDIELFFIEKLLFSVLISSDKYDAIFKEHEMEGLPSIPYDLVDYYVKGLDKKNHIDNIRDEIFQHGKVYADLLHPLDNRVTALTVPTGTGKTFTAFNYALHLAERLTKEKHYDYKFLYCLPFTSIIDQNYSVFDEIYRKIQKHNPTSQQLLKHHSLADVFYKTNEKDYNVQESCFMIENWKSRLVVTTFIQFFHTLFSNGNRTLMKFYNLANRVIILDEVQSIPYCYWLILRQVFVKTSYWFDVHYLFVTATQPLILHNDRREIYDIIPDCSKYFAIFNRTRLYIKSHNDQDLDDFFEELGSILQGNPQKDVLIVLNTIRCSRDVYKFVRDLNLPNTVLYYLSTQIIPKHRKKRIERIREKDCFCRRKVIVSTQLIEAGVDIDVDIVVRDFAPVDSINQVAGRCNRNGGKGLGNVYLYSLKNKKGVPYHSFIYDSFLISTTKDVLQKYDVIEEKEFGLLIKEYFEKVKDGMSDNTSNKLLDQIKYLEHEKVDKDFQLIKEMMNRIDLFIAVDEEAEQLWNQYECIKMIKNPNDRREEFLKIKNRFYQYVISVDERKIKKSKESTVTYISREELPFTYHIDTGFNDIDEHTIL